MVFKDGKNEQSSSSSSDTKTTSVTIGTGSRSSEGSEGFEGLNKNVNGSVSYNKSTSTSKASQSVSSVIRTKNINGDSKTLTIAGAQVIANSGSITTDTLIVESQQYGEKSDRFIFPIEI